MTMTRADTITDPGDHPPTPAPNPAPRPTRRRFTADYKLSVLAQLDQCSEDGAKGALLRREGLYSSHIVEWRRARDSGALGNAASGGDTAGRINAEVERLRRRNMTLQKELEKTRAALDVVGKTHALLELLSESAQTEQPLRPSSLRQYPNSPS